MSANALVILLSGIWAVMTALMAAALTASLTGPPGRGALDQLTNAAMWFALSMVVAIVVLALRIFLQDRLTGPARWLAWIPPAGVAVAITALSTFGHVVGQT